MIRVLVKVSKDDRDLLGLVSSHCKMKITFDPGELLELEKFVSIMDPLEALFSSLNSSKEATLHRVLPIIKVKMNIGIS